jgi:hypothetical protein
VKRRSFLHSLLATAAVIAAGGKGFAAENMETVATKLPTAELAAGKWSHVAVARSASGMRMFLNGVQVDDIKGLKVVNNASNQICVEHNGHPGPVIGSDTVANLITSDKDYTFELWLKPAPTNAMQVSNVTLSNIDKFAKKV